MSNKKGNAANDVYFELGSDDLNGLNFGGIWINYFDHINIWYDEPDIA